MKKTVFFEVDMKEKKHDNDSTKNDKTQKVIEVANWLCSDL